MTTYFGWTIIKLQTLKISRNGMMVSFNPKNIENYDNFIIDIRNKDKKTKEEYWATILIVED